MLFTPRRKDTGVRMTLDIEECEIPRGSRWTRVVVEKVSGKRWRARGASCGCPGCYCDAIVEEL